MANRVDILFGIKGNAEVSRAITAITGNFTSLSSIARRLAVVLGPAAVAGTFALLTKQALAAADATAKLAQGAGVNVREFSAMTHSANLANLRQIDLAKVMGKLSIEMVKQGRAGADLNEELFILADEFEQMPDGAAKTQRAIRLFGDELGQKVIPLLNQGSAALRAQRAEAERFGLVIGQDFAEDAQRFQDNMTRMSGLLRGTFNRLVERILPTLNSQVERFVDWIINSDFDGSFIEKVVGAFDRINTTIDFIIEFQSQQGKPGSTLFSAADAVARRQALREEARANREAAEHANFMGAEATRENRLRSAIAETRILERTESQKLFRSDAERARYLKAELGLTDDLLELKAEQVSEAFKLGQTQTNEFLKLNQEYLQLQQARADVARELAEASTSNIGVQLGLSFEKLRESIGTTAQVIARNFTGVIQGAIDGISNSISGLIRGTLTWGDALRNIGGSIINSVINAISRMFAEWIVGRALMAAKNIIFAQAEGAAETAAKAPGAVLTSISSYGVAAAVGLAAVLAAVAAFSFETGGFTGAGPSNQPAGIVHSGEFVMPANAVSRIGIPTLEAMRAGDGSGGPMVNVVIVDSRKAAKDYLKTTEGVGQIVDIMGRKKYDL